MGGFLERLDRELAAAVLDVDRDAREQRDAGARRDHLHEGREARGAEVGLGRARTLAESERLCAKAMAVLEQEHRLVLEVVERDRLLLREQVRARDRGDERVVEDDRVLEVLHPVHQREQARVQLAAAERCE